MSGVPIFVWKLNTASGGQPQMERWSEDENETMKAFTPVAFNGAGMIIERSAIDGVTKVVLGICDAPGSNLTTEAVAQTLTQGSVVNQTAAKIIPIGVAMNDGRIGVIVANDWTEFQCAVQDAQSVALTDIGKIFGLTKDGTTGLWYVDTSITAAASGACVRLVEAIDPPGTLGGKVAFVFSTAYQQYHS